jgi:pimeloyl-ACP methyl ester carboxylesterase
LGGEESVRKLVVLCVALAALAVAASAHASEFAPADAPGPVLSVPKAELRAAVTCEPGIGDARRQPVLLVPGTTLTPDVEYSWNWEPALRQLGIPFCTVELPTAAMGDIQVAAEYVVYAVRLMHQLSGRRVDVLGHSQGGMIGRWALRFWPGLRARVDDLIGLAPSNHGTLDAVGVCAAACPPAFWQQRSDSRFTAALNSQRETFKPVDYTVIYTHLDEVVVPNTDATGSSALHGGGAEIANIALQDVCPADTSEHLAIGTYDNVAYELAVDALTHPGPADPARIAASACETALMPGVDPSTFPTDYANEGAFVATTIASSEEVSAEPALACYVTASCAKR